MANVKITDLTEDATPADGDWVETVDISAGASKKVTRTNFFLNPPLGAGSVDPEDLVAGTGTDWAWQTWTPTLANLTLGNGAVVAKYIQIGKTVHFKFKFTLGSTSAVGTSPTFTPPVTAAAAESERGQFIATYQDTGASLIYGYGFLATTGTVGMYAFNSAGTYVSGSGVTATVPITFATTDVIMVAGTYEAA